MKRTLFHLTIIGLLLVSSRRVVEEKKYGSRMSLKLVVHARGVGLLLHLSIKRAVFGREGGGAMYGVESPNKFCKFASNTKLLMAFMSILALLIFSSSF